MWDRANIMKIVPTWPRASLSWYHQSALQDRTGEVGKDKIDFIDKKDLSPILQDICATLRIALNINQWCSTENCFKMI